MPSAIPKRDSHRYGDDCPGGHGVAARKTEDGAPALGVWLGATTLLGEPVPVDAPYPCRCALDGCGAGGFWRHCPCRGRTGPTKHLPAGCCARNERRWPQ